MSTGSCGLRAVSLSSFPQIRTLSLKNKLKNEKKKRVGSYLSYIL